jgi:hypothetical protein
MPARKPKPSADAQPSAPDGHDPKLVKPGATDEEPPAKNPAAVELGRLGGLKGGAARAAALSAHRRSEIARTAAAARWAKRDRED